MGSKQPPTHSCLRVDEEPATTQQLTEELVAATCAAVKEARRARAQPQCFGLATASYKSPRPHEMDLDALQHERDGWSALIERATVEQTSRLIAKDAIGSPTAASQVGERGDVYALGEGTRGAGCVD